MKERPILFKGDMVKAVLEGRKTQTRRVLKPRPDMQRGVWRWKPKAGWDVNVDHINAAMCPYGSPYHDPSDRLWVRETFYQHGKWVKNGKTKTGNQSWMFRGTKRYDLDVRFSDNPPEIIRPNKYRRPGWYKRPSIFMPRWASRILLEVTGVRVERVQDISEDDAMAEGVLDWVPNNLRGLSFVEIFRHLWNSINIIRRFGWDNNDWVWVVEFKRIDG